MSSSNGSSSAKKGSVSSEAGASSAHHYSTFTNDLQAQRLAALQASADEYKEERERGALSRQAKLAR